MVTGPDTRIQRVFQDIVTGRRPRLIPYFTAGFPDNDAVADFVRSAESLAVPCIEIGFPFSDSIADGAVIQASHHAALEAGQTVDATFRFVSNIRKDVTAALVAMVSYSILYRAGVDQFVDHAAAAGFDGLIVPDVPLEEADPIIDAAERTGIAFVGLVAPTTPLARRLEISQRSSGFVYQLAVAGTTGERQELPATLAEHVRELRRSCDLPIAVGFGISTPEQVRAVCTVADAAIVGSAVIRRIADAVASESPRAVMIASVSNYLAQLASAARISGPAISAT